MPALQGAGAPGAQPPAPDAGTPDAGAPGAPVEAPASFDITEFENAQDAFASLLAYAEAQLARGPEGHLALLQTLNDTIFDDPGRKVTQQLVASEEEAARFLYPVIKFAMDHHVQVADMMETIYKTAAEDPARFEDFDDDTLEMFTEGIAYVMPGMVGPDRLARLSKHAEAILAQDAEKQPHALQRNRRDIEQALRAWKPPMSPEDALAKLQSGTVSPEEIAHLIRRVPKEMLHQLDVDALIGPALEANPIQVLGLLRRLQPKGAVCDQLDRRVIRGMLKDRTHPQFLNLYLRYTERATWAQARPFLESGLQQTTSPKGAGLFAEAALGMEPDKEWLGWVLETYELPESVRTLLDARLK